MAIRKQNRCPACGNGVDLASMVYSAASQTFVCPACLRAGTRPPLDEPAVAVAPPSSNTSPPPTVAPAQPSFDEDPLAAMRSMAPAEVDVSGGASATSAPGNFRSAATSATSPAMTSGVAAPVRPPRKPLPSWAIPACALIVAALLISTIAILFLARARPAAADPRRAWEEANRERIIALKTQAEELTIARKLPEAHAKYRELEKLIGGQQIGDPRLFDLVDQARLDQSRVYRMILHSMNPAAVDAGPLPSAVEAAQGAATAAQAAPADAAATQSAAAAPRSDAPPRATQPAAAAAPVSPASTTQLAAAPPPTSEASTPDTTDTAAAPGASRPAPRSYNVLTDAEVDAAIRRGVDFLIARFENGQIRRGQEADHEHKGLNALAVFALLQAGQAIRDDRLSLQGEFVPLWLDRLKGDSLDPTGEVDAKTTYARSLRASALATLNRPQDRDVLKADVDWLVNAAVEGSYTYDDRFAPRRAPKGTPTDNPPARREPTRGTAAETDARAAEGGAGGDPNAATSTGAAPGAGAPTGAGGARISRLDLGALRPPSLILAHNGEVIGPPPPPPWPPPPVITRPQTPSLPSPPRFIAPPSPYTHTPVFQLPQPGSRGKLGQPTSKAPWDNSNSQFGVLGVWAGAERGIEVPQKYWADVRLHWQRAQLPSGQWSYGTGWDGSYSMTAGGVATLMIAHDYLEAALLGNRTAGRKPYDDFITAGLAFLEHGDNVMDFTQSQPRQIYFAGYNLFALERVGLASGLKYFGKYDWYVELASKLLPFQHANGAWGRSDDGRDAIIDTAYMLLFLSRGRHPVMMNKLRYDGFWTNRPRDIANLASYASRELERPINWQVVDVNHLADDWADSPILYIAGHQPPKLAPHDVVKLKLFVEAGGLLFTHADLGADGFNTWAAKLATELFPGRQLENLSPQHALYTVNYKIDNPRPTLQAVGNGVRLLMVHSPSDMSNAWQVRGTETRKPIFQLGANLYLYATGKERFRNRLDTRAVPPPSDDLAPQIDIAQVQYDGEGDADSPGGNWNPEPGAWLRFAKSFQNNTGTRLVVHAATPQQLDVSKHVVAVMSGITERIPTADDLAPTAKFVRDGGTLLVDACGGSGRFANAIEPWLAQLDPAVELEPMSPDDVFLQASDAGATAVGPERLRLFAVQQIGANAPRLKTAKIGKGRVIFTPLDYTSGLLGTNTWGILGYLPEYSEALATNVVLVTSKLAKN